MRKYGVKEGTLEKHSNCRLISNFEWTICYNCFQSVLKNEIIRQIYNKSEHPISCFASDTLILRQLDTHFMLHSFGDTPEDLMQY